MERNSSIFPAYFAAMTAEERAAFRAGIEQQRKTADRLKLLRLDIAMQSVLEIWNECTPLHSETQRGGQKKRTGGRRGKWSL